MTPTEYSELMKLKPHYQRQAQMGFLTQAVVALIALGLYRVRNSITIIVLNPFFLILGCLGIYSIRRGDKFEKYGLMVHFWGTTATIFNFFVFALAEYFISSHSAMLLLMHIPLIVDMVATYLGRRYYWCVKRTEVPPSIAQEQANARQASYNVAPAPAPAPGRADVEMQDLTRQGHGESQSQRDAVPAAPTAPSWQDVARPPSGKSRGGPTGGNNTAATGGYSVAPRDVEAGVSEEEEDESKMCKICREREIAALIYPCGHTCVCWECGVQLKNMRRAQCPICRQGMTDLIRAYLG
eukprot:GFYU01000207.1.p1 GENE.GFYU01000207.1~~GFYU01000207.1.p1  ORF type:complete len:346 (+),score=43.91 GFYU01000207.1:148-1038(+)